MNHLVDTKQFPFRLTNARVAVLGYGPGAAIHASGLREAGNHVSVGMRSGGMSWVRARRDGFPARPAPSVIDGADVVVVLVPDDEQASVYWHAIEPNVTRSALLVFGRALALATGAFDPKGNDAVFVATDAESARVAVHRDATGRALERAISYARAAIGSRVTIGTTTVAAEVDAELAALEVRAGGPAALLDDVERAAARARESHAPDEARLRFYEGLCSLAGERAARSGTHHNVERGSAVSLIGGHGPRRGMQ